MASAPRLADLAGMRGPMGLALLLLLAAPGCGAARLWTDGRGPWSDAPPLEARAWAIDQAPVGGWPAAWAWSDGEPRPDGAEQAPAWRPTGPCYAVERAGRVELWTAGPEGGGAREVRAGRRVHAAPLLPDGARPVALRPVGEGALVLDDPAGRAAPFAVHAPALPGASTAARLLFAPLALLWDLVPAPLQRLLAPVLP